jgi:hypothetical protein
MDTRNEPRVTAVDRLNGDVIVSFSDNRDALYPATFLHSSLPLVQEIHDSPQEEYENRSIHLVVSNR